MIKWSNNCQGSGLNQITFTFITWMHDFTLAWLEIHQTPNKYKEPLIILGKRITNIITPIQKCPINCYNKPSTIYGLSFITDYTNGDRNYKQLFLTTVTAAQVTKAAVSVTICYLLYSCNNGNQLFVTTLGGRNRNSCLSQLLLLLPLTLHSLRPSWPSSPSPSSPSPSSSPPPTSPPLPTLSPSPPASSPLL